MDTRKTKPYYEPQKAEKHIATLFMIFDKYLSDEQSNDFKNDYEDRTVRKLIRNLKLSVKKPFTKKDFNNLTIIEQFFQHKLADDLQALLLTKETQRYIDKLEKFKSSNSLDEYIIYIPQLDKANQYINVDLSRDDQTQLEYLQWLASMDYFDALPENFITIGTDGGGNEVIMNVLTEEFYYYDIGNEVTYMEYDLLDPDDFDTVQQYNTYKIANSFEDFAQTLIKNKDYDFETSE